VADGVLALAQGGLCRDTSLDTHDTPLDIQTARLRAVLGLLGITDVEIVYAEGLNMGDKARSASLAEARSTISMLAMDRILEVNHEAA